MVYHSPETPIDNHFVLSLRNLKQGRYYTLFTYTFAHTDPWRLCLSLLGTLVFAPLVVRLYGFPALYAVSMGSTATGAILQLCDFKQLQANSPDIVEGCTGSEGAILALITVFACSSSQETISGEFNHFAIPWLAPLGIAFGSFVAWHEDLHEDWIPSMSYARSIGGILFGAGLWKFVLHPIFCAASS